MGLKVIAPAITIESIFCRLENYPQYLLVLLLGGLEHPVSIDEEQCRVDYFIPLTSVN